MVLKTDIEKAYRSQLSTVVTAGAGIPRGFLDQYQPAKKHIEVITGIRRCGKSTLMRQIMKQHYTKSSFFNFEDARIFGFNVSDFQKLEEIMPADADAYFFDEIQNVDAWEIFIRQLHDSGKKIFITGSNASLLSKELGTRLTGRHLRHELFPFSFKEFLQYKNEKKSAGAFKKYLFNGGFPEYLASENTDVLQTLLKDIVLRDIAIRHGVRGTSALMDITLFLISNIGKEHSYNNLKKNFGLGSANTVADYLNWLEDSYLLFFLPRFSYSAKSVAVNPRKVYAIDNGLVNANSLSFTDDAGRLLENIVYLYLRQQPNLNLYYFRENKECDFVVFEKRNCKAVIQACMEINSDNQHRETDGLLEAMHFFKLKEGTIVTLNQKDTLQKNGNTINIIPAHEFFSH